MAKKKYTSPNADEFLQLIQAHSPQNSQIASTQRAIIKPGPRAYKVASVMQIQNPATWEIRHKQLHLNSFPFRVDTGVDFSVKDGLAHWSCKDEEIDQLTEIICMRLPSFTRRLVQNASSELQQPALHVHDVHAAPVSFKPHQIRRQIRRRRRIVMKNSAINNHSPCEGSGMIATAAFWPVS